MSSEILQKIAKRSQAAKALGLWAFLKPVVSVRHLPFGDSELAEGLYQDFTPDQLEKARVLVRRDDKQLELNPALAGKSVQGLFLRRKKDEAPFDIVTQKGCLATDDPPAFGCDRDYFTKRFSGSTKSIFVTFSDEDLAVFRMLSLPCTSAAGLATMNGERLRRLFGDAPGFPASLGQSVAVVPGSYRLLLVGWSLAELANKSPAGVTSVVKCLLNAEDAFGFDTSQRLGVWQPAAGEFNRIYSAAEFEDRALVHKLIWRSASSSTRSARQFEEEVLCSNAANYDAARRELLHTLKRARELGFQSSEIAKRLDAFNRSFDKSVVDAIVCDAMAASDSVDRALLLAASELMGHWHKSSSLVRSTENGVSGRYIPREEGLHPEELKERLRVVDGLVKIHRELTRNK